jgi:hypothetical protein
MVLEEFNFDFSSQRRRSKASFVFKTLAATMPLAVLAIIVSILLVQVSHGASLDSAGAPSSQVPFNVHHLHAMRRLSAPVAGKGNVVVYSVHYWVSSDTVEP